MSFANVFHLDTLPQSDLSCRYRVIQAARMAEPLTNEELIQLFDAVNGSINSQFELWVTITFAVIIASHVAGHQLTRSLQYLIATLYVSVSVLLSTMLIGAVVFAGRFEAFGFMISEPTPIDWIIAVLRGGVWIFGTIATIIFIFKRHRDGPPGA
jgi:hypothetical protein